MQPNVQDAIASIASRITELKEAERSIEAELKVVLDERKALLTSPISFEDYLSFVDDWVDRRARAYEQGARFGDLLRRPRGQDDNNWKGPPSVWAWARFESEDGIKSYNFENALGDYSNLIRGNDVFGALCFFFADIVKDRLHLSLGKQIGGEWGNKDAMPLAQRRVRMEELDDLIDEIQDRLAAAKSERAKITSAVG